MKQKVRIIIPCVIVVVVVAIFATHTDSLMSFVDALTGATVPIAALAFGALLGRYFMYAWAFKAGFRAVGADIPLPKLIEIIFSITFINDTAPTAGMAGSVYMGTWAHKKGASSGGAISLIILDKITFFGSMAILQTLGLVVLAIFGQLSTILILGCLFIYALAIIFCGALFISLRFPNALKPILGAAVRIQNFFLTKVMRKQPVRNWAPRIAESMQAAAQTVISNPHQVLRMFARMFALFCCEAVSFALVSVSFGYFDPAAIVAAYVAGFVMSMLVVQTVGVVETVLVVMLTAFGADFGVATAIALVYRGMQFWLPFAVGGLCLHRTSKDFSADAPDDGISFFEEEPAKAALEDEKEA